MSVQSRNLPPVMVTQTTLLIAGQLSLLPLAVMSILKREEEVVGEDHDDKHGTGASHHQMITQGGVKGVAKRETVNNGVFGVWLGELCSR